MPSEITSKDNLIIKQAVKLKSNAKDRREENKFFIEGFRLCLDAIESDIKIVQFFYTDSAFSKHEDIVKEISAKSKDVYLISEDIAQKLSDTVNPQGFFGVCEMPNNTVDLNNTMSKQYIALENIQDPSNMGTILRTAEAFGISGMILSSDCCDIFNAKVIRGSMGAVFRLPITVVNDFPTEILNLRKAGLRPMAAVPDQSASKITGVRFFKGVVMCIGNEGNGLTKETIKACGERVTIPMDGQAESLNAATSASILMWEMIRK